MGQQRYKTGGATAHTLASAWLRLLGQLSVLAAMLMANKVFLGTPWGPYALAGFGLLAAGLLFSSALLRNIARWQRQAACGQPPQSMGTATLAAMMALQVVGVREADAVFNAEGRTDALEAERIARLRREQKQQAAQGAGVTTATAAEPVRVVELSEADVRSYTLH
jgi:uncharacterized membrane protein